MSRLFVHLCASVLAHIIAYVNNVCLKSIWNAIWQSVDFAQYLLCKALHTMTVHDVRQDP